MRVFQSVREWGVFALVLLVVFGVNLSIEWVKFIDFKDAGEQNLTVKIEQIYTKNSGSKKYTVMRLDAGEYKFYTTTRRTNHLQKDMIIALVSQNLDVGFVDYLKRSFYMPSWDIEILSANPPPNLKQRLLNSIAAQHQSEKISQLYGALYLAAPIDRQLRDDVMRLGISHLIAISGYHLGVIMGLIYFVLTPIFRRIYRDMPWVDYRHAVIAVSLVVVGVYFWIIGFVPSFFRAFMMSIFALFIALRGLKILSFETLFSAVLICVAFVPSLAFSVGFYFSVFGVLCVFIYVRHFGGLCGYIGHSVGLNLYAFFSMQVVVAYFFPMLSVTQLFVLVGVYGFVIFYPLSFLAHLVGFGGVFDGLIEWIFSLNAPIYQVDVGILWMVAVNLVAILAMKFRFAAVILAMAGVFVFVYFQLR